MRFLSFALSFLALVASAHAATIQALTQLAADVQTAINKAANGDTVQIPAGVITWDLGGLTISKGITLDGTGVTVVRGLSTSTFLSVTTNATVPTRITGFTFNEVVNGSDVIDIGGGFNNARFRIDHCTFYSTAGQTIFIRVSNGWGVIDHCTFSGDDASEMVHNEAWGPSSDAGWKDVVTPGGPDALYIEDNTFSKTDQTDPYYWGCSAIQSYYGARTVVRHNTFNYCQVDQHGTAGNIGARWWEIYNNVFNLPANSHSGADTRNQSNYMAIRAGSGVIFNNTKGGGPNDGSGSIELYEEDTGYPALYQIGRGQDTGSGETSYPAYCWSNMVLAGSGSSNVIDGRDFYSNTQRPGYTPYTYPNPLTATTQTAPSGASIQIKTN
ncbi:MAG TPA: hypothetical protein VHD32_00505 [Candidatus Didemnitutus sp.]|nr:hypothetical protein [Candidatus Didemnitutus sp.]